jgi:hypothetical protein
MSINEETEVEAEASFEPPKGMKPSKGGSDWADGGDDTDTLDVDAVENAIFTSRGDDEDGEDFVDEEQHEDGEDTEPDADVETDSEEIEAAADDDEAVEEIEAEPEEAPALSPRANERIRQLVEEKNAERQRVANLEAQLAQFIALQQKQAERQEAAYQAQLQADAHRAKAAKEAQMLETLRGYGFNEGDVGHQLGHLSLEVANETREELRQLKAEREQARRAEGQRAYNNALIQELNKSLSDPTGKILVNDAVRETLYRSAYAIAASEQIQNPSEAVKRVVAPILVELRKAAPKPATKRPSPKDPVHKVIATQGRAVGKSPGTRASGRKPVAQDVKAFLK